MHKLMRYQEIPASEFAVVKDIERNIIVYNGTFIDCENEAKSLNFVYQSTAYVAQGWNN